MKSLMKNIKTTDYKFSDMVKALYKYARDYKKEAILSIVFIALETFFECCIPFVMAKLIDVMQKSASEEMLNIALTYGGILLGLAMCSFICGFTSAKTSAKASVGYSTALKSALFRKINSFSFNNIDKFSVSSLVTRQTVDVFYIQNAFMITIRIGIRAPLMLIFALIMTIIQSPRVSWIFAITIPVLILALGIIIRIVIPIFMKVFTKFDKLNESIEENVRGIRVVKTYVREDYEKEKFGKASDEIKKGFVKAERIIALNNPIMMCTMYLSMSLIIFIGSLIIIQSGYIDANGNPAGDLTLGQMSSMITYGTQILSSLMMVSMIFVMITMSMASMERVYEVLIEKPTIVNPINPVTEVKDGTIEFKNVSFKYKETAKRFALSNINLKIKNGQMIGIVGGTGSSKSTLVNLISRFYDTTEGEVLVSGINVKDYDIKILRNNVSMVLQKNILFSGTIKDNLKWGNKNATDEEIIEACKIAQADSFVEGFPDKYETYIQQGGSNVSGGQKQRLCIARAILKKPKVLIFDDSTSAVDTKTDALIKEGLRKALPNTTKIIIAQRLSSVEDADLILVMDDGMINGMGTHEELLKTNEIYKEIYNIQNKVGGND